MHSEHLTELLEYHKLLSRLNSKVVIQLGNVIPVEEATSPRHQLDIGKVTRLFPGKGRQICAVVICGTTKLNRPIKWLYPIGVLNNQKDCEEQFIKVVKDRDIPVVVTAL